MFRVTKELSFCYGHRLLNHNGKCRNLHGHNGKAAITVEAEGLDSLGMVVDFGQLKETVGRWIDETLDHKMLLHRDDPVIPELERLGEPFVRLDVNPTAENLARLIFDFTRNAGFTVVDVTLWESENSSATYRGS